MASVLKKIVQIWKPEVNPNLPNIIRENAKLFDLDPKLVACIIYQESAGDSNCYRVEEDFYNRYLANKTKADLVGYVPNFPPTLYSEKKARATSFGVMQTLGETARLMGYDGRWLPSIKKDEINVYLGCKFLRRLFDKASKIADENDKLKYVLTRWNGSSQYVKLILNHMRNEQWRIILKE